MRCVVICQPYASAIIEGIKDVENRTWAISTGPLAIMAGKSRAWLDTLTRKQRELLGPLFPWEDLPYGKILGMINVIDVKAGPLDNVWSFGLICWLMKNPRKFVTPILYRGRQGIFHVPDELLSGEYV